MIGRFGKTLSETFFRSYVEKLYGRPWNEIDPEFGASPHRFRPALVDARDVPVPLAGDRRDLRRSGPRDRCGGRADPHEQPGRADRPRAGRDDRVAREHRCVRPRRLDAADGCPRPMRCRRARVRRAGRGASHGAQHGARVSRHPRQPVLPRAVAVRVRRGVSHGSGRQHRTLVAARLGASGSAEPDRVVHRVLVHPRRRDVGASRTPASRSSANGNCARATSSPRRPGSAPRTYVASPARIRYRVSTRLRTSGTWATTSRPSTISMSSAAMPSTVRATSPTTCRPVPRSARGSPRCARRA